MPEVWKGYPHIQMNKDTFNELWEELIGGGYKPQAYADETGYYVLVGGFYEKCIIHDPFLEPRNGIHWIEEHYERSEWPDLPRCVYK